MVQGGRYVAYSPTLFFFLNSVTEFLLCVAWKATASMLRSVMPNTDIRGESLGDKRAALRSTLAVHHRPTKLLYLTGYKNRNTFSDILGGAGVSPHSLEVYEACTRPWEAPLSLEIVAVRPHSI